MGRGIFYLMLITLLVILLLYYFIKDQLRKAIRGLKIPPGFPRGRRLPSRGRRGMLRLNTPAGLRAAGAWCTEGGLVGVENRVTQPSGTVCTFKSAIDSA